MPSAAPAPIVLSTPAILIGAAPTNLAGIEHCAPEWRVVAADGGLHTALANHIHPSAVIGDMDSVGPLHQLDPSIELIHQNGQDDTDFEKCLNNKDIEDILETYQLMDYSYIDKYYIENIIQEIIIQCRMRSNPDT